METTEIQERSKQIAFMLGWKYISSLDTKNSEYDSSIKAGWYSKVPKDFRNKLSWPLYKGRAHVHLRFYSDWNRLMEPVEFIEKIEETEEKYGTLVDISTTYIKVGKVLIDLKVTPMKKQEAVFIAVSDFATLHNNKEL